MQQHKPQTEKFKELKNLLWKFENHIADKKKKRQEENRERAKEKSKDEKHKRPPQRNVFLLEIIDLFGPLSTNGEVKIGKEFYNFHHRNIEKNLENGFISKEKRKFVLTKLGKQILHLYKFNWESFLKGNVTPVTPSLRRYIYHLGTFRRSKTKTKCSLGIPYQNKDNTHDYII